MCVGAEHVARADRRRIEQALYRLERKLIVVPGRFPWRRARRFGYQLRRDGHPAPGLDGEALVRPRDEEHRHGIAKVVDVRLRDAGGGLDLQLVVQALLVRERAGTEARDVMRHRHRLAVLVPGRVHDLVRDGRHVS
jgi:hypothetical protein